MADASAQDGRLRVVVADATKFTVLQAIDENVTPVRDFSVVESSLEDLFVRYTNDEQEVRV